MTPKQLVENLARILSTERPNLQALSPATAKERKGGGPGWSRKQELGHLLDSATNNRVRFVKTALEGSYIGPTYDGDGWVNLAGYQQMEWTDLVDLWYNTNQGMVQLIAGLPENCLQCSCTVDAHEPVTLEFLIDDYRLHMQHHLDHILSREQLTNYPGAALGV